MKKLLVISSAIAMLSLSGAAYAGALQSGNSSTQVQVGTFLTAQSNFQLGSKNSSTQVAVHTAFTAQNSAQFGFGNSSTQISIGSVGSARTTSRSALDR